MSVFVKVAKEQVAAAILMNPKNWKGKQHKIRVRAGVFAILGRET